ncbi:Meiosis-specific protein ASY1 [Citrus sinensis]|nr:Meiosis-specific protein ASY1 [Citrus sinensis]
MNINRTGNKKKGGTFKCNTTTEITTTQMRSSACKMVRTLVQLMRTLDRMPEERTILMKLFYYDDVTLARFEELEMGYELLCWLFYAVLACVTIVLSSCMLDNAYKPVDYEPPFFRCCSEEEAHNPWTKNPLKMEVGNVNSKHFVLALKVKSVLDPCEDENDDMQDDEVSLGADSVQRDESSDSDSEVSQPQEDQYIVAPIDKQQPEEDNGMVDEDNTQDPEEDEQQLVRVKDWINCRHLHSVELTDVLSNFPDISVALTEEIMGKLVKEGLLSKGGKDTYTINKQEALYYALSMNYVTIAKLQKKLDKEANQSTVRKLIDKMIREGYVEAKGSRRLGKRVIHSTLTKKKLMEVKKALDIDFMEVETIEPLNKSDHQEFRKIGSKHMDTSTCGLLHSVGSDVTRTKGRSDIHQSGSFRGEQAISKAKVGNTPTSRAGPVASRESFAPGNEKIRTNGSTNNCDEVDDIICSRSTQDKRLRKTSTVKEPILQQVKRQKSLAMCV